MVTTNKRNLTAGKMKTGSKGARADRTDRDALAKPLSSGRSGFLGTEPKKTNIRHISEKKTVTTKRKPRTQPTSTPGPILLDRSLWQSKDDLTLENQRRRANIKIVDSYCNRDTTWHKSVITGMISRNNPSFINPGQPDVAHFVPSTHRWLKSGAYGGRSWITKMKPFHGSSGRPRPDMHHITIGHDLMADNRHLNGRTKPERFYYYDPVSAARGKPIASTIHKPTTKTFSLDTLVSAYDSADRKDQRNPRVQTPYEKLNYNVLVTRDQNRKPVGQAFKIKNGYCYTAIFKKSSKGIARATLGGYPRVRSVLDFIEVHPSSVRSLIPYAPVLKDNMLHLEHNATLGSASGIQGTLRDVFESMLDTVIGGEIDQRGSTIPIPVAQVTQVLYSELDDQELIDRFSSLFTYHQRSTVPRSGQLGYGPDFDGLEHSDTGNGYLVFFAPTWRQEVFDLLGPSPTIRSVMNYAIRNTDHLREFKWDVDVFNCQAYRDISWRNPVFGNVMMVEEYQHGDVQVGSKVFDAEDRLFDPWHLDLRFSTHSLCPRRDDGNRCYTLLLGGDFPAQPNSLSVPLLLEQLRPRIHQQALFKVYQLGTSGLLHMQAEHFGICPIDSEPPIGTVNIETIRSIAELVGYLEANATCIDFFGGSSNGPDSPGGYTDDPDPPLKDDCMLATSRKANEQDSEISELFNSIDGQLRLHLGDEQQHLLSEMKDSSLWPLPRPKQSQ